MPKIWLTPLGRVKKHISHSKVAILADLDDVGGWIAIFLCGGTTFASANLKFKKKKNQNYPQHRQITAIIHRIVCIKQA